MCETKKQAWDTEVSRRPIRWSMPDNMSRSQKIDRGLDKYGALIKDQLDNVHRRLPDDINLDPGVTQEQADAAGRPETDTEPPYAARIEKAQKVADVITFERNLEYIADWKQYEQLELLIQRVDLATVTIPWLQTFREDLDLKV